MNGKQLLVAGLVFVVTTAITDEIVKDLNLPKEAKPFISKGVGAAVAAIAHSLL